MGENIYIPTLDPRGGGGVLSVTKFAYNAAAKAGFDPHIVYNTIPWEDCITIRDILTKDIDIQRKQIEREGLYGTAISRIVPEIESLNYILNHSQWMKTIDKGAALGVGGPCFPCLPLALADKTYHCWVGTLMEDEREVQLSKFSFPRQVRYLLERPILKRYEKITLERADRLFVQSSYTKQRINDKYGISQSSIELLPVPIDIERFKPKSESEEEEDGTNLVFIGRFNDPRKNVRLLLRAFRQVHQAIPNATLTLIGDEPSQEISNLITDLSIGNGVRTPGHVPDVVPYLQNCDGFVMPSSQEGLGIAGLEAMSCGVPVVATKCGGPEDYVLHGETGFLVPVDDENRLADHLIDLLENPKMRQRLGANARDLIEERYAKPKIKDKFTNVLNDLPDIDS